MVFPVFCGDNYPVSKQSRLIALEEQRKLDMLKAEQVAKECETNSVLRNQMQLEAQRDFAFQQMQDLELHRIYALSSPLQQIPAHKQVWAWRKQAKMELEQLRETERLSRERFAQDIDLFTHPEGNSPPQTTKLAKTPVSPSLSCPNNVTSI